MLRFIGPGFVVAVGFLDPGNWATDLEAGANYEYRLLFFVLISNIIALVVQYLAVKLGIVSGMDLAQVCRKQLPKWASLFFYVLAEIAIISTDLAEVIGSSIALNLLFDMPLYLGVIVTSLNIFVIMLFYNARSVRAFELIIIALVLIVGTMFVLELFWVRPDLLDVFEGFAPPPAKLWRDQNVIFIGMGIVGATVMPHNLFLHSNLVKHRAHQRQTSDGRTSSPLSPQAVRELLKYTFADCVVALTFAVFVNAAILIVAGSAFYGMDVAGLFQAYELLANPATGPGPAAATIFALALLLAGQSSTFTATLGGQVVMEGFLGLRVRPWVRRLITRSVAIIPAMMVALSGSGARKEMNNLLVLSQVALSIQLPFCVIPLLWFTGNRKIMRLKHTPRTPSLALNQSRSEVSSGPIRRHNTARSTLGHELYGKRRVHVLRAFYCWLFGKSPVNEETSATIPSPVVQPPTAPASLNSSDSGRSPAKSGTLASITSVLRGSRASKKAERPSTPELESETAETEAFLTANGNWDGNNTSIANTSISGSSDSTSIYTVSSVDSSLDTSDEEQSLLGTCSQVSHPANHGFAEASALQDNEGSQPVINTGVTAATTSRWLANEQAFRDDLARDFANKWPLQIAAWISGLTVLAFNILLLKDLV